MTKPNLEPLAAWSIPRTREFPWRRSTDPFKLVVTELMLVRTKARQVAKIWPEFFKQYPSLSSLAAATEGEVEHALRSLGLRWRARKIRNMAKELSGRYPQGIPPTGKDILQIAELGPYSARAAAISVQGFGELPVDWGIARVLSRLSGITSRGEVRRDRSVLRLARKLSPCSQKTFFGMVDLARETCLPRNPLCYTCPLATQCAFAADTVSRGGRKPIAS